MEVLAIVRQLLRGTDALLDLHGSSGFSLDSPLQRFWRDLNAGARHVPFTSYITIENRGLQLTGAPPISPS
jgi:alkylation response protein AidB-like acyl-CoA dehydrogenase